MRISADPPTSPDDYPFVHEVRVRFAETDAMGIVHHSRYLPMMEEARVRYLDHVGHPYESLRADGDMAVLEVSLRYRMPLRFDEQVDIHLRLADGRSPYARIENLSNARRAGVVRAEQHDGFHGVLGQRLEDRGSKLA